MNLDLSGRRALVCGSSAGIGRACAAELASLGASVTLLARDRAKLEGVLASLPHGKGQGHDVIVADLSNPGAVEAAVKPALDASRPYHILVNNTGGPPAGPAIDATPEHLVAAVNAQLITAHVLVRLLLPGFQASRYGRVINITSTSVKQPIANLGISNVVRPAVTAWAKCLSQELGKFGITVNNVLPGYTATERLGQLMQGRAKARGVAPDAIEKEWIDTIPLGRLGEASDIAAGVAFLASPAGGYVSGINLPIDGGRLGTL